MKILLAEDEVDLSNAITAILESQDYKIDQSFDGDETLSYLDFTEYDLVILDIMMPKKNGLEVLEIMRDNEDKTPVLILTAKDTTEDIVKGLNTGADDYLTKPFEMKELLARVNALLRRPKDYVADTYTFEDLTLDRANYKLISGDKEVELNNKEYQLIEYLLLNSKQVLSSEKIMERIWGLESDSEINVVWVNISSLRKKIEEIGSKVTINAIRGVGYKLGVEKN